MTASILCTPTSYASDGVIDGVSAIALTSLPTQVVSIPSLFASPLAAPLAAASPMMLVSSPQLMPDVAKALASDAPRSFVKLLCADGTWRAGEVRALNEREWTITERSNAADPATGLLAVIPRAAVIAGVVQRWAMEPVPATCYDRDGQINSISTPLSAGLLELDDGQRLPGLYQSTSLGAAWEHRWIGTIALDPMRIACISMLAAREVARRADTDVVLLLNGDVVTGFVESLGSDVVLSVLNGVGTTPNAAPTSTPPSSSDQAAEAGSDANKNTNSEHPNDVAKRDSVAEADTTSLATPPVTVDAVRRIPVDRVGAVAFTQIDVAPSSGALVWTMDGSLVRGRGLGFSTEAGWSFELVDPLLLKARPNSTADNLAADPVGFVVDATRWLPLASCVAPVLRIPDGAFQYGVDRAVRIGSRAESALGLATIELTGSAEASFAIPASMRASGVQTVFSATVVLAEPAPADVRVEITVSLQMHGTGAPTSTMSSITTQTILLDATHRRASIVLSGNAADASALVVRVSDGGNGSVGDRVLVERAVLLAAPGASSYDSNR